MELTQVNKPILLVVDDCALQRHYLMDAARRAGFECLAADDGDVGLDAARSLRPQAILTDIYMSRMDGIELIRALRGEPRLARTPVLVVTGDRNPVARAQLLAAGASGFFTKPVTATALQSALQRLVTSPSSPVPYESLHASRVEAGARLLARAIGLPEDRVDEIGRCAALHDAGLRGVDLQTLCDSSVLSAAAIAELRSHAPMGGDLLERAGLPEVVWRVARHHHERWDGGGYPDGLRATEIPLEARIVSVADVWAALRTRQPWRPAFDDAAARSVMRAEVGRAFDPALALAFLSSCIDEADLKWDPSISWLPTEPPAP
ncbi:MAG: response regulator [Myxococcota bacterium]